MGCNGDGIVFFIVVFRRVSTKAHFHEHFWQFKFVSIPEQLFPSVCDNTANKFATFKHIFCTPKHIVWYLQIFISHQSISHGTYKHSFSHHSISHCTRMHTHSHFTPKCITTIGLSLEFTRHEQALLYVSRA